MFPNIKAEIANFSPRSLYRERQFAVKLSGLEKLFQSTLPIQGATTGREFTSSGVKFQSTLPIQGATLGVLICPLLKIFQSTLPIQGATKGTTRAGVPRNISIHAPYTGSDSKSKQLSLIILLNIISFANSFANNKTIGCIFAI